MIKVYCKNCRYLTCYHSSYNEQYDCSYKDNSNDVVYDKWYERIEQKGYIDAPRNINKNNDCIWYNEDTSKISKVLRKLIRKGE